MIGSIKKIFASIFGIFGAILKLPVTLISLPFKLLSSKKDTTTESAPAKKQKKDKAFFLEAPDAKGVPTATATPKAATPKQEKKAAAVATATPASALNLPLPTVTASNTPASTYKAFGPRRRPGANMKSYLDMAKTVKGA
jgi:hypothetical protein